MTAKPKSVVTAGKVRFGNALPFSLIAGPCVLESRAHAFDMAGALKDITARHGIGFVFKTSFDKANRTSAASARGLGLHKALAIFAELREKLGVPVLTDVHEPNQCAAVAEAVDILQIPAFLCRQTDLLVAAGNTGRVVNIKKGQFVSPAEMANAAEKVASTGNEKIILTERGASFGYQNLVVDMRSFPMMRKFGYPVVFDATHSVQLPAADGKSSGGQPEFIEPLARASVAAGVDGIFVEVHDDPSKALSDGSNALPLEQFKPLVKRLMEISKLVRAWDKS